MKHLLILTCLLFTSCLSFIDEPIYSVPDSVDKYIEEFTSQANIRGLDYPIQNIVVEFHNDDEMKHAMADIKRKNGYSYMRVNKKYWDAYENYPLRREAIIMHELGHIPLMRPHIETGNSLMNIKSIWVVDYEENKKEMLDELFGVNL